LSDYADPDLETIAPLPAGETDGGSDGGSRAETPRPWTALVAALAVVALVVGFGVATIILNASDSASSQSAGSAPFSPTSPAPGSTTPPSTVPADPDEAVLPRLIVRQQDVPPSDTVRHLTDGADLSVATLDLCNGTFATEAERTARRQVGLVDAQDNVRLSTEAILYRDPGVGTAAFGELRSVAAHCPSTPVKSPVGEPTVATKFAAAPDATWPRTASVDRLAYDFTSIDPASGTSSREIAVYLRRGRVLMGLYFPEPAALPQVPVGGHTTIPEIVAFFEARMAKLPARVVQG